MSARGYKLRLYLVVVDRGDGSYASAMDTTGWGPRKLEKVESGLHNRVDFDRFYVDTIRRKRAPEVRR